MATTRANPRQAAVGTGAWIQEERNSVQQWTNTEAEGFTFAAHNEVEWLNEHMAEIFSQNQSKFADIFKTPGKLRGKTPRTARKLNSSEARAPLSDVFSATPIGAPSPFRQQTQFERQIASFRVAEDDPVKQPQAPIAKDASPQRPIKTLDSGYHGSQSDNATDVDQEEYEATIRLSPARSPSRPIARVVEVMQSRESEERRTTEGSFESAREEQTKTFIDDARAEIEPKGAKEESAAVQYPVLESPKQSRIPRSPIPRKPSPERPTAPPKSPSRSPARIAEPVARQIHAEDDEDERMDDVQSPSDGSSPIRPIVRKSSLNFASLPAREPITSKKSVGNRTSRTSHLDQTRTSYYGRQTGGKSLGNAKPEDADEDEMDVDSAEDQNKSDADSKMARIHSKTSTQRLQDQISMLGQSQANARPRSKSIASNTLNMSQPSQPSQSQQGPSQELQQQKPPLRTDRSFVAPGAFPEDEDDSWIGPPTAAVAGSTIFSPRPQMSKSHSTDVMVGIHGMDSIGGSQFNIPKRGEMSRQKSPVREFPAFESTSTLGHTKSVSTSILRSPKKSDDSLALSLKKGISVSNPNPSTTSLEESTTPPKSPSRIRGSPLKAAKDKFSSILKTSRGLFASSAAVSTEAKNSALSPPSRSALQQVTTTEDVPSSHDEPIYPSLDVYTDDAPQPTPQPAPDSPSRGLRKTRASIEREEKRKEEAKEAKRTEDQLEKARLKVKEEARQHHLEQECVAAMEKQILARKEQERLAKASQVGIPRATRTSPRKTKAQLEAEGIAAAAASSEETVGKEVEMTDASAAMPPPSLPRPKPASQISRPGVKRPLRPTKDTLSKGKAPTVIRVDTGSQRGHQYHPSNSTLAASLQDSLPAPAAANQSTLRSKASTASLQSKASTNSFKSSASKALEAAARKKEQDELAAQRKREAKLEVERQRAALKDEERRQQEQQRRQEAERQRELQREKEQAASVAEAKKAASRQAMEKRRLEMEKAKQTRAPPPAARHQASTDQAHTALPDKPLPALPLQRSDMSQAKPARMNPAIQRPQDDMGRSVSSTLQNNSKAPPKRPLQQDPSDDHHSRPQLQRNGPSYQQNDNNAKRRKTSEGFDDDDTTEHQPRMMAPPIRQSSIRPKEIPTKSLFPSGYANAPLPASSLSRSTLISQHNMNQSKPAHPMDMAQVSKAPIAFASSSSQPANQLHKTPARPAGPAGGAKSTAKSAARSSPRYQNGENIELPEINTDSEDEDEDDNKDFIALKWTNSPDLRRQLARQETIDPVEVFGPPGPLNMEEVFSKSKDRFHKFRARTSSANWTGQDRLTEDEIKKDLEARDRVRRQGGWTYDSMV